MAKKFKDIVKKNNNDNENYPDFEADLLNSEYIMKAVLNDNFAQQLYAALCNIAWWKDGYGPEKTYSCSWRFAGGY